jgi:hypothetical protein
VSAPAKEPNIRAMVWETPCFVEIRMDAELAAYCDALAGD